MFGINKNGTKHKIGIVMPAFFPSSRVTYDNTQSGLTSTDVQDAIDELVQSGGGSIDIQRPTFTEASTRANIESGETISTLFGKIKKFFTDLKTVAFTGAYSDLTGTPTIPPDNSVKDYNNNTPTKFGYSTLGMAQSAATWLGAWDTSVSGEYRLRAVKQADLKVAYATSAGSATTATNADTVDGKHLDWGNGGNVGTSVTYLAAWKNDGTLIGWVKRSDISVNYATSAGSASTATNASYATSAGSASSASSASYAGTAGSAKYVFDSFTVCQQSGNNARIDTLHGHHLLAQDDKNLVWYSSTNSVIWQSGTSSRRFKHNIQSMTEERARKILQIRAVTFDWNDNLPISTQKCDNAGVIAEEVSQVIPDVVVFEDYDNDPNVRIERRVEYERFTPYLIKMVQMQQKQIDTMQATINALERRLSILEADYGYIN